MTRTRVGGLYRAGQDWNEWRHDPLYLWIENERKNATMILRLRRLSATMIGKGFVGVECETPRMDLLLSSGQRDHV